MSRAAPMRAVMPRLVVKKSAIVFDKSDLYRHVHFMGYLHIRPMPLSPVARRAAVAALLERMGTLTIGEIVEERVAAFYALDAREDNALQRRMKRYHALVYTRAEIAEGVRAEVHELLAGVRLDQGGTHG